MTNICRVGSNILTDDTLKKGVNDLNVVLNELDSIGKYTFQELINIISYIAIIEEFNYPKISVQMSNCI